MKKITVAIPGLFVLLYILPLGIRPFCIPDETRYAEIPREMIASGDWVVPHLNGIRYFEKPVLGYWINAASMMLFGENAFAARFPSAMAAGISGVLLFLLVRRFGGGGQAGAISAAVFLTCSEVFGVGTFCVLDTLFSMFVTLAMVCFFFGREGRARCQKVCLGLCGVSCGLAFLTKGFIAFAVPVVAIVPFMIWEGRIKDLLKDSWLPIATALLVVLPWAVIIHLREPDFWHYFFWTEHIKRFFSEQPQHSHPFWFFLPVIIAGAIPWTALIPAAVAGLRKKGLKDSLLKFALCWFLFPFLFFSASSGKLGTYILPCFAPFAVLMAAGLLRYLEDESKRAFTIGASCLAGVMAACVAAWITIQLAGFPGLKLYGPEETYRWIWGAVGLLTWSALSAAAGIKPGSRKGLAVFCIAPLLFMFSAYLIMPDQARARKAPGDFLMRHAHMVRPGSILVAKDMVRAVCWFYGRDDVLLFQKGGELDYGLRYNDSNHRLLGVDELRERIRSSGKKHVILISKSKGYERYRKLLPKPAFEDTNGYFVFACFQRQ